MPWFARDAFACERDCGLALLARQTMATGNLAKWILNEGDKVEAGGIIAEVRTSLCSGALHDTTP